MHKDESQSILGTISIHNNVIANIASIAAKEIEGVKALGANFKSVLLDAFGKKTPAIRVEIDRNSQVTIWIPLIVKYGFNIPDIANKVQENTRNALEKMTNLSIKDINVTVQGIEK